MNYHPEGVSPGDISRHDIELDMKPDGVSPGDVVRHDIELDMADRISNLETIVDGLYGEKVKADALKRDAVGADEDGTVSMERLSSKSARKLLHMKEAAKAKKAAALATCVKTCQRGACKKCPSFCKTEDSDDADADDDDDDAAYLRRRTHSRKRHARKHAAVREEEVIDPALAVRHKYQREASADDTAGYTKAFDPLRFEVEMDRVRGADCPMMFIDCALECKM